MAFVLLVAHGLGAPRSAWAGCNHLVTSQSDRQLDVHRLDDLITGDPSAPVADDPSGRGPRSPRPCSGPGCSGGVPWPAPSAIPVLAGRDQWIALESVRPWIVPSPPRLLVDEPAARPVGHKPSIFHPPPA